MEDDAKERRCEQQNGGKVEKGDEYGVAHRADTPRQCPPASNQGESAIGAEPPRDLKEPRCSARGHRDPSCRPNRDIRTRRGLRQTTRQGVGRRSACPRGRRCRTRSRS
jgi:hypothetical protein